MPIIITAGKRCALCRPIGTDPNLNGIVRSEWSLSISLPSRGVLSVLPLFFSIPNSRVK